MASAAARDALLVEQLNEVDAIVSVETRLIDDGDRLRKIDPVWVEALGELMLRQGQRTPIDICVNGDGSRFELAGGGGHRLAAARAAGIEYVRAIVHSADADARREREIAENLHRRDLDPIERAAFVAEAVAIQKRRSGVKPDRSGRSIAAQLRWQKELKKEAVDANAMIALAYGWSEEVAAQLGLSRRTIEYDLLLYRRLPPSLIEQLRAFRHPILSNATQLRTLAKLDEADQGRVVDQLTAAAPAKSVSEALGRLKVGLVSDGKGSDEKRKSAFIGSFQRMGLTEKKGALIQLAELMPKGFRLVGPSDAEAQRVALEAAFKVLTSILDGDPVSDEDAHDAASMVQQAIIDLGDAGGAE